MNYVCLCYGREHTGAEPAAAVRAALAREQAASSAELRLSGQLLATAALEHAASATLVRVRNGAVSVETITSAGATGPGDPLRSVVLIEARDFNDAIRIAARLPAARFGTVEVRPTRAVDIAPARSTTFQEAHLPATSGGISASNPSVEEIGT